MKSFEFNTPTFNAVVKSARAGDFLGMGTVGERLYGQVFPGLNNNVRHLRAYAAICWAIDHVYTMATANSNKAVDVSELLHSTTRLLDKVQLLLTWQAAMDNEKLVPGMSAFKDTKEKRELTLDGWPVKTTFLSGLYYLPGLVGGFGLINRGTGKARNTYSCTPAGKLLARGFKDEVLKLKAPARKWLLSTEEITCNTKRLDSLRSVTMLGEPSELEKSDFLWLFLEGVVKNEDGGADPSRELREKNARKRKQSVVLALRALEALDSERRGFWSIDDIRLVMSAGYTPKGSAVNLTSVERSWREWHLLQVRQLQRLAMEVLLGLVERIILLKEQEKKLSFKPEIVEAVTELICDSYSEDISLSELFSEDVSWYKREQKNYPSLQAAGLCLSAHSGFLNIAYLKTYLRGYPTKPNPADMEATFSEWATAGKFAVTALMYCAIEVQNLRDLSRGDKSEKQHVDKILAYDEDKLSLDQLTRLAGEMRDKSTREFVRLVLGRHVIEQHLQTATARSELAADGQNRFVFTQEHHGLSRWREGRSNTYVVAQEAHDILLNVLLLLDGCGCLLGDLGSGNQGRYYRDAKFRITAAGRKLLKHASSTLQ